MESRFGHDFTRVRVHTDSQAAGSARSVFARAYTVGSHVVFGADEFASGRQQGRELLAHELAHTVQQRDAGSAPLSLVSEPVSENSAETAGRDIASGRYLSAALSATPAHLARAPVPIDAYRDDMLAKHLLEVEQRLKQESYAGRDRDVDVYRALTWEADKRDRAKAVAQAESWLKSTTPLPPSDEPKVLPKVTSGGFSNEDIDPDEKQRNEAEKKNKDREALKRRREEEGRPARLRALRNYLTLHGVMNWDMADTLTQFLTVNDLHVLRKNGLDSPGFFTRRYADKVIAIIDKIAARDPMEDRANLKNLQKRAADIEATGQKIEALPTEGLHALAGRVEGALVAYAVGKDPLWSSEVGAAFGGLAGALREARAFASMNAPVKEPPLPTAIEEPPRPVSMRLPTPKEPPSSGNPDLRFRLGTDVTKVGPYPTPQEPAPKISMRIKAGPPAGSQPLDPSAFKRPSTPPPKDFRGALDRIDIAKIDPSVVAQLRKEYKDNYSRNPDQPLENENDYVRFRGGRISGQWQDPVKAPGDFQLYPALGRAHEAEWSMISGSPKNPGAGAGGRFRTPWANVDPDFAPSIERGREAFALAPTGLSRANSVAAWERTLKANWSPLLVADSKHFQSGIHGLTDQLRGFIWLAQFSQGRALVIVGRQGDRVTADIEAFARQYQVTVSIREFGR